MLTVIYIILMVLLGIRYFQLDWNKSLEEVGDIVSKYAEMSFIKEVAIGLSLVYVALWLIF